jgi:hypothetical protein
MDMVHAYRSCVFSKSLNDRAHIGSLAVLFETGDTPRYQITPNAVVLHAAGAR